MRPSTCSTRSSTAPPAASTEAPGRPGDAPGRPGDVLEGGLHRPAADLRLEAVTQRVDRGPTAAEGVVGGEQPPHDLLVVHSPVGEDGDRAAEVVQHRLVDE